MSKQKWPFNPPKPVKHGDKWRIRWVNEMGERKSQVFADWSDAYLFGIERGLDAERRRLKAPAPQQEADTSTACTMTFAQAAEAWQEQVGYDKRSRKSDESFLKKHLLPALGDVTLDDLTTARVVEFRKSQEKKRTKAGGHLSPSTVHHHLTLLGTILRFAHREGWIAKMPQVRKPKLDRHEDEARFLKSHDEIERFLRAAREEGELVFMLYATPLFLGLRCGEVCGLHVRDIDLDDGTVLVARSYDGPTKNRLRRRVPIAQGFRPHLEKWVGRLKCGLVFTNQAGGMLTKDAPYFKPARYLGRVLERAGLPRDYITYHCLRHTYASQFMSAVGDEFRLREYLGHLSPEMTRRYSHVKPEDMAADAKRTPSFGVPEVGAQMIEQNR